jgi:hypothetical protein
MSSSDERRPRRMYFTEFINFWRIVSWFLAMGLIFLGGGEAYFWWTGEPKAGWVTVLEDVYGIFWKGIKAVGGVLSSPGQRQSAQAVPVDPDCGVAFVQFEKGVETGRWTFVIKDLTPGSTQVAGDGNAWQQVVLKREEAKGAIGWVSKPDWDAKLAKSECQ